MWSFYVSHVDIISLLPILYRMVKDFPDEDQAPTHLKSETK